MVDNVLFMFLCLGERREAWDLYITTFESSKAILGYMNSALRLIKDGLELKFKTAPIGFRTKP